MSLTLISSERFAVHQTPPGHPESPERAEVMDAIVSRWRTRGCEVVAPREATDEQLLRVHSPEHLQRISATAGRAVALDADTYASPESYQIAKLSAGAAVDAVERVLQARTGRAMVLSRPPGHHAERQRAMGFCFFNNVAVAAAHARSLGAARVAIVDFDVHHGNGTQHMFEADPDVLYISTHQYPFYPGTGAADEVGLGDGRGFTVNLPIAAGAVDEDYQIVFSEAIVPVLREFAPTLLLVSAGFDAHERDPLANMRLTTNAFRAMALELQSVSDACCGGRMVLVTEGGYDLRALAASLDAVIDALSGPTEAPAWLAHEIPPTRGRAAVDQAKAALSPYWRWTA
jgi:acetoin utilization deacetylase AcuC-like enzyme